MSEPGLLLAPIVFVAFASEALTGFGCIVIALTLGSHLYPVEALVPVLVPLNMVLSGYILARDRHRIAWPLLLREVLPWMGLGTAVGVAAVPWIEGRILRSALGVLVVAVAAAELRRALSRGAVAVRPIGAAEAAGWYLAAGVVHGIYGAGGPPLVAALSRVRLSRAAFRGSLALVWQLLNSLLIAAFLLQGRMTSATVRSVLILLPVVILATAAGQWAHQRVNERAFRGAVSALLLVAGASLLV